MSRRAKVRPRIAKSSAGLPIPTNDIYEGARQLSLFDMGMEVPRQGFDSIRHGFERGYNQGIPRYSARAKGAIFHRTDPSSYEDLNSAERAAFAAGRVAADVFGHGTRQILWSIYPDDGFSRMVGGRLKERKFTGAEIVPITYLANLSLGAFSENYNPFNFEGGGRARGYASTIPDENDPRISKNPIREYLVDRGILGRRGGILPWEYFKQEMPGISYQQYEDYKEYLYGKDGNPAGELTLGQVKGTFDGPYGPEASIQGYRVTPAGAIAGGLTALAGGAMLLNNKMRRR
jgi:hypothetical protein